MNCKFLKNSNIIGRRLEFHGDWKLRDMSQAGAKHNSLENAIHESEARVEKRRLALRARVSCLPLCPANPPAL